MENNLLVKILPLDKSKVMIQVSREDREKLADLIDEHYNHSISRLAERIGMHAPNVYNALNGARPVSLKVIDDIMSGIGFQADLQDSETLIITLRKDSPTPSQKPKDLFGEIPEGTEVFKREVKEDLPQMEL